LEIFADEPPLETTPLKLDDNTGKTESLIVAVLIIDGEWGSMFLFVSMTDERVEMDWSLTVDFELDLKVEFDLDPALDDEGMVGFEVCEGFMMDE
jgi:hypothetical protein